MHKLLSLLCWVALPLVAAANLGINSYVPSGNTLTGTGGNFGQEVVLSDNGKVMAVGARDLNSQGGFYVYTRDTKDSAWTLREGPITTTEPNVISFGRTMTIDDTGKTIAVGSLSNTVIVYRWSTKARKYQEAGVLKQLNPNGGSSNFGHDEHPLALSGDGKLLAIGANQYNVAPPASSTGAVFMYGLNKAGTAYELLQGPIIFSVPPSSGSAQFGRSVALDKTGKTLAVGAEDYTVGSTNSAGAVFVYKRDPKTKKWAEIAGPITASNVVEASSSAGFGQNVALSRNAQMLFVSAREADVQSVNGAGTVYVFKYNKKTRTYEETQLIVSSELVAFEQFGAEVEVTNNNKIMVVGAYGNNAQGNGYGSFYVYRMGTKGQYQLIQRVTPDVNGGFFFAANMGLSGNGKLLVVSHPQAGGVATYVASKSQP